MTDIPKNGLWDWEGDTVIGKNHKGGLVTLAERKSRYVLAGHISSKHAEGGNGCDNTPADAAQG